MHLQYKSPIYGCKQPQPSSPPCIPQSAVHKQACDAFSMQHPVRYQLPSYTNPVPCPHHCYQYNTAFSHCPSGAPGAITQCRGHEHKTGRRLKRGCNFRKRAWQQKHLGPCTCTVRDALGALAHVCRGFTVAALVGGCEEVHRASQPSTTRSPCIRWTTAVHATSPSSMDPRAVAITPRSSPVTAPQR